MLGQGGLTSSYCICIKVWIRFGLHNNGTTVVPLLENPLAKHDHSPTITTFRKRAQVFVHLFREINVIILLEG